MLVGLDYFYWADEAASHSGVEKVPPDHPCHDPNVPRPESGRDEIGPSLWSAAVDSHPLIDTMCRLAAALGVVPPVRFSSGRTRRAINDPCLVLDRALLTLDGPP